MAIEILESDTEVLNQVGNNEDRFFSYSMNHYHIKRKRKIAPKILIVGTMTPTGNKGYYYTSLNSNNPSRLANNVYSYINSAYRNLFDSDFIIEIGNARSLNEDEICNNNSDRRMEILSRENKKLINKIKNKLYRNNICFFDVFYCVKRKKFDSYKDDDIMYASLDFKSFERIFRTKEDLEKCKIIVDSEKALNYLLNIINNCFQEYNGKIYCVPQLPRRFTKDVKRMKGLPESTKLKEIWEDFLVNDYDGVNDKFKQFVIKYDCEWPYKIKQHNSD